MKVQNTGCPQSDPHYTFDKYTSLPLESESMNLRGYLPTTICGVGLIVDGIALLAPAAVSHSFLRIPLSIVALIVNIPVVFILKHLTLLNRSAVESNFMLPPSPTPTGWFVASLVILAVVFSLNSLIVRAKRFRDR